MSNNINGTGDCDISPVPNVNKNNGNVIFSSKDGVIIRKDDNAGGGSYDSRNKFYKDSECG